MSDYLDLPLEPDPVIEAYKKDVDVTLLDRNLALTVEERFRQLESMARFVEAARKAREAAELELLLERERNSGQA